MSATQQQLFRSRRELVHDIRNLFQVVASAKHILDRRPDAPQRAMLLEAIEEAARRGGELATRFLASTPLRFAPTITDVGRHLADLAPMMRALIGARIEFDLEIGMPNALVRLDQRAFDAAIFELVANAIAAGANTIVVRTHLASARVWILVCDDGRGMARETLVRARLGIDANAARGAGLPRVRRFAEACDGQLWIRSRLGGGTSVAMILPALPDGCADERALFRGRDTQLIKETIDEKDRQPIAA